MAWITALLWLLGIAAAYGMTGSSFLTPLANYVKSQSDPDVPPQKNAHTPVQVFFMSAILNIAEVNKEHNTFTSETFVGAGWDSGITWNPAEYGGVDMITLPKKYFWTPRLQALSTAIDVKDLSVGLVTVFHNGTTGYNQLYKLEGLCDVSHIETGASCNSNSALWGYSKDQVMVTSIGGAPPGVLPFFSGSKYEITGYNLNFIDLEFDGKHYQIINSTISIKEKSHVGQKPMKLHFDFH